MKKKMSILLIILCITQLLSSCGETPGLESDNYNYQVEIIYQEEGYTPSCAYQLFSTVYYETGYEKLDSLGMKIPESSNVILGEDRKLGEIEFRTRDSIEEDIEVSDFVHITLDIGDITEEMDVLYGEVIIDSSNEFAKWVRNK